VVAEAHRLGNLQVGVSGHDTIGVILGGFNQSADKIQEAFAYDVDLVAEIESPRRGPP
jgi:hypothetical protein